MHAADADLSIVVGATAEHGHACHKLFSQTLVPACSPTLLQRTPIDTVSDLNHHTLIVHEARRDGWQRWAEPLRIELQPKKLMRLDTMHAAAEAAEITVRDNGTGIPPGDTERIFQPFVTTKSHGLGLGLAICRSVAEAHQGVMWAENAAEGGAIFHMKIPIAGGLP